MSGTSRTSSTAAQVRAIEPADVPRVWELLRELAEYEKLTDFLTGNDEMLGEALFGRGERLRGLVAEREGRLVGYALYFPVFGSFRTRWRLWLEDLYVEPAERGRGTGKTLMAELARAALDGGYYALDWEVLDWNAPSIEFYERLGSRRIATDWFRYRLDGDALQAMGERARPTSPAAPAPAASPASPT